MGAVLRYELARLRHRLGCDRCSAGTHAYLPRPEDPDFHLWLPPGWRKAR